MVEKKFIEDGIIKLRISRYLEKELSKAGFSRVEIQKTPLITRITVYVTNPGKVIGRGGEKINSITEIIRNRFKVENPEISVAEVQNEKLEPRLVARFIANSLERGVNPRRLLHSAIRDIMLNGALGAEIIASGKLAAKGARAKTIKVRLGYLPKAGDITKFVDTAKVAAYPKYGAIGVTVSIVQPGTTFPGQKVKKIEPPKEIVMGA
ncbi:MAG: 30S ribosomal protein S3 [Candidatus Micrarchaeaceae archaeon]